MTKKLWMDEIGYLQTVAFKQELMGQ